MRAYGWRFARSHEKRLVDGSDAELNDERGNSNSGAGPGQGPRGRARHQQVSDLFLAAIQIAPASRAAYLESVCGNDEALRREVEELLARDAETAIVDTPVGADLRRALDGGAAFGFPDSTTPHPPQIGRYRIVEVLGQGGMGVVYKARQSQPERFVALKVINPALLSAELLRRFELEAQMLAELQHPGIAQIFDADTADLSGARVPFFAMELIDGQPLTAYAQAHKLDHRARLALLRKVCEAVHHAHQKGVIHRDLKPANILVNAAGQPKILDFGVARATGAAARAATLQTQPGEIVGTLPYMSPEQVAGDPRAVDIRSDVYALGIIAYELLAGDLPFRFEGRSLVEAMRLVETGVPEPLGRRDRALRGDVETLVARALHKDIARRYSSAAELGREIERYLAGEPIDARRDSRFYVLRKALARHRVAVAAGGVFVLLLAAAAVIALNFAIGEARQRGLAERRARETQQVAEFQAHMFQDIDVEAMGRDLRSRLRKRIRAELERQYIGEWPDQRKRTPEEVDALLLLFDEMATPANTIDVARDLLDKQIVDRAARMLREQFADQPAVRARLHLALGTTSRALGLYEAGERHLRAALDLQRAAPGPDASDIADSLTQLAHILHSQKEHAAAEELYREALERTRRRFGPEDPRTAIALANLSSAVASRGDYAAAELMQREALALLRRFRGEESLETARALNNLGELLRLKGDFRGAEAAFREALAAQRARLGEENPREAAALNNLANLLTSAGRYEEAEPLQRAALDLFRRLHGDEHPHTIDALANLANTLRAMDRLAEAEPLYRDAIALHRKVHGDNDPGLVGSVTGLGMILQERGNLEEAERESRKALALVLAQAGDQHPDFATVLTNLAAVLHAKKNYEAAEPMYRRVLAIQREVLGAEHPALAWNLNNLAALLRDKGDFAAAEPFYREAVGLFRKLGDQNPNLGACLAGLGRVFYGQAKYPEAEAAFRESVQIQSKTSLARSKYYNATKARLGRTLVKLGRHAEAEKTLLDAGDPLNPAAHLPPADLTLAFEGLIELYDAWHVGEPDKGFEKKAAEWRAKLAAWRAATQPASQPASRPSVP